MRYRSLDLVMEEVIMSTITEGAGNSPRLLSRELLETAARLDGAACIAQAISQRMDPEWREFVDQEQRKRRNASLSLFRCSTAPVDRASDTSPTEAIVSNRL
jgi:hypothetical protein